MTHESQKCMLPTTAARLKWEHGRKGFIEIESMWPELCHMGVSRARERSVQGWLEEHVQIRVVTLKCVFLVTSNTREHKNAATLILRVLEPQGLLVLQLPSS